MSTWKFTEDVDVGDMEYGSGYPAGLYNVTICCIGSVTTEVKM